MKVLRIVPVLLLFSLLVCCKSKKQAIVQSAETTGQQIDEKLSNMEKMLPENQVERNKEGIKVTYSSEILFAVNSSILTEGARIGIQKLTKAIDAYSGEPTILIDGYTDNTGAPNYNKWLSERRAASVKSYMEGLGIKASRIKVTGYGDKKPLDSNASPEGRAKNRRVEITLVS